MLKTSSGQTAFAGLEKKLAGSVPDDSEIPGSVRRAVRLMLWGGAVTAVLGVFLVIATIADKNLLLDSTGKKLSGSQLTGSVVYEIVIYLLLVTVWVVMARMNRAGRGFARWIASTLAAISTFDTFRTVNSLKGGQTLNVIDIVVIAGTIVTWLIGVLAVAMLWRSESSEYFRARAGVR
jgi:hypothetical protein